MTDKNLPSIEYLHKRLRYEPDTGKLFWRDCEDMSNRWRAQFANKEAFTSLCLGYRRGSIDDKTFRSHRVAWAIHYGYWPISSLDHINGDRADNRINNLRLATHQENMRNRAINRNNTSGICGVYWVKSEGKWKAHIKMNKSIIHLGYFQNIEEAAAARAEAATKYGFSTRHGQAPSPEG